MCLAIPAKISQLIEPHLATADYGGNSLTIEMGLVDAAVGDYVLVHAGCAIEKIDPDLADEILGILGDLGTL